MEIKLNLTEAETIMLFRSVCEFKWRSSEEYDDFIKHGFTEDPKGKELVEIAKDKIYKSEILIHQINKALKNF